MDNQTFNQLQKIKGISGVSILDDMGATIHTTIKDPQLNEVAGFLAGIGSLLENDLKLGKASRIVLKSPKDDSVIIHITDENNAIALFAPRKLASSIISRKIENIIGICETV
jgi:predicted regulator of Ras-like GTPase activity (Roadblock/LC7/MglB family)